MIPLSFPDFDIVYQDSVSLLLNHWTVEMQQRMAVHGHGWSPGLFDVPNYLRCSSTRFYRVYLKAAERGTEQTLCDVGGQMGVLSVTLSKLGFDVTMTETLKYYGDLFKEFFECIAAQGVKLVDYDPFEPEAQLTRKFDFISVMAVIEHYPHSLKSFMGNIMQLMNPEARIYIEVPNIAYFPKRLRMLLGHTPLAPVKDIFLSEVPFIGHHHEFTISELRDLVHLSGLAIREESFYNYSLNCQPFWKKLVRYALEPAFLALKDSRECMAVLCERSADC